MPSVNPLFIAQGSGAIGRPIVNRLRESHISIADFGAVGDGSTDNAVAIAAASVASTTTGLPLFIPAGTFNFSGQMYLPAHPEVFGVGRHQSILSPTTDNIDAILCPALPGRLGVEWNLEDWTGSHLHDFGIHRLIAGDPTAGSGLKLTADTGNDRSHGQTHINNLSIEGFWVNLFLDTCESVHVTNSNFYGFRKAGIWQDNVINADMGDILIALNEFGNSPSGIGGGAADRAGVWIQSGSGTRITSNKFWFNPHAIKVYLDSALGSGFGVSGCTIDGNYFDGQSLSAILLDSAYGRGGDNTANIRNTSRDWDIRGNRHFVGGIDIAGLAGAFSYVKINCEYMRAAPIRISGAVDHLYISGNEIPGDGSSGVAIRADTPSDVTNLHLGPNLIHDWAGGDNFYTSPPTSIWSKVSAHWSFTEATGTGTRADASGLANTITPSASVTRGTGIIGNCVTTNGQSLATANGTADAIHVGYKSWTMYGWINLASKSAFGIIAAKWDGTFGFLFGYDTGDNDPLSTDRFFWSCAFGGSPTYLVADAFGSPSTGTPYFFCLRHSYGSHISMSINLLKNFAAFATSMVSSQELRFMGYGGANYINGSLCQPGIVQGYAITEDEERKLYGNGFGATYAQAGL